MPPRVLAVRGQSSHNKREWNNCFIKNYQEILLDVVDFALQERPEDNFLGMV